MGILVQQVKRQLEVNNEKRNRGRVFFLTKFGIHDIMKNPIEIPNPRVPTDEAF